MGYDNSKIKKFPAAYALAFVFSIPSEKCFKELAPPQTITGTLV